MTCPTGASICYASQKVASFYFKAMFMFWCLQFTDPNKHGLLNLSSHLHISDSAQEHVFKVGLYHKPNQINEMNDSRGGRCFECPLK